ncbi:hypothetical protein MGSAQ_001657 [marine sediment metagenome]|uniref:Uncharacterized protein n=1 Tax=marine sediment metagenome TaxID=412755 RepID=A0A1B6NU32_9ZZZZ
MTKSYKEITDSLNPYLAEVKKRRARSHEGVLRYGQGGDRRWCVG